MAKGIDIAIAADTRSAMSAINRGLIDPLEDVSEALEDIGKEGPDATEKLERSMRDAQRRTDDAKDEIRDLRDELNKAGRQGKRSGDDIGDGMRKAGDDVSRVGEATGELKQEIAQNMGEAVSSFRGDAEDISQIGQDTFGGLAATVAAVPGFGIPAALGLAAGAAGWGIITGNIQEQGEAADRLRERLTAAYSEAAEAGLAYLDTAGLVADLIDLQNNPERAGELQKVLDTQKATGIDLATIYKANYGDLQAIGVVADAVNKKFKNWYDDGGEQVLWMESTETQLRNHWQMISDEASNAADKNAAAIQGVSDVLMQEIASMSGDVEVEVDKLGNKLVHLPDGDVFIDANTGQATLAVDKFEEDADGVIKRTNAKKMVLTANTTQAITAARNAAATIAGLTSRIKVSADTSQFDRRVREIKNTEIRVGARIVTSGMGLD